MPIDARNHRARLALAVVTLITGLSSPALADAPPSKYPIFQSHETLTGLRMSAPFSDLFTQTRKTLRNLEEPVDLDEPEDAPSVTGTVEYLDAGGKVVQFKKVTFTLRGNTSKYRDECPFPKLTLKFETDTKGTIFGGHKKIKLATHCGDTDTISKLGRLQNQRAALRESLLYTVLSHTSVMSLFSRAALITYTDTSGHPDPTVFPNKTITRNAFFLEDEDSAAKRYGAKIYAKSGVRPRSPAFNDAQSDSLDPASVALSVFAEALTENPDWFLRMSRNDNDVPRWKPYSNWNIHILRAADRKLVTLAYDWDLSGWVRGPWHVFNPGAFALERLAAYPKMTQLALDQAQADFLAARNQIYKDVDEAFADPAASSDVDGRNNITKHLDMFYDWLSKPLKLNR